jgi:hypothetical protein
MIYKNGLPRIVQQRLRRRGVPAESTVGIVADANGTDYYEGFVLAELGR